MRLCSINDCSAIHKGHGYCSHHLHRVKTTGDPNKSLDDLKHHKAKTPEYLTWRGLKSRCLNPKNPQYKDYGGRGIGVCERWSGPNSFPQFFEDMGKRPLSKYSLDRINVNGNYEPSNCRWTDRSTQAINQRTRSTNKSGYRGVCWVKSGYWVAQITYKYESKHLGYFKTKEDAALAYNKEAVVLHGVEAKLNKLKGYDG